MTDALGNKLSNPSIKAKPPITRVIGFSCLDTVVDIFPATPMITRAEANAFSSIPRAIAFGIMTDALGNKLSNPSIKAKPPITRVIGFSCLDTVVDILPATPMITRAEANAFSSIPRAIAFGIITDALGNKLSKPKIKARPPITRVIGFSCLDTVVDILPATPMIAKAKAKELSSIPRAIAFGIMTDALGNKLSNPSIKAKPPITRVIGFSCLDTVVDIRPVLPMM